MLAREREERGERAFARKGGGGERVTAAGLSCAQLKRARAVLLAVRVLHASQVLSPTQNTRLLPALV